MRKTREKILSCLLALALILGSTVTAFGEPIPDAYAEEAEVAAAAVDTDDEAVNEDEQEDEELAGDKDAVADDDPAAKDEVVADGVEDDETVDVTEPKAAPTAIAPVGGGVISPAPLAADTYKYTITFKNMEDDSVIETCQVDCDMPYSSFKVIEFMDKYVFTNLPSGSWTYCYEDTSQIGSGEFVAYLLHAVQYGEVHYYYLDDEGNQIDSTWSKSEMYKGTTYQFSEFFDASKVKAGQYLAYIRYTTGGDDIIVSRDLDQEFTVGSHSNLSFYIAPDAYVLRDKASSIDFNVTLHFVNQYGKTIAPDAVKSGSSPDGIPTKLVAEQEYDIWEKLIPENVAGCSFFGIAATGTDSYSGSPDVFVNDVVNENFLNDVGLIKPFSVGGSVTCVYYDSSATAPDANMSTIKVQYEEREAKWERSDDGEIKYLYAPIRKEIVHTDEIQVPSSMYLNSGLVYDAGDYRFREPFYPVFREVSDTKGYIGFGLVCQPAVKSDYTLTAQSIEEVMWLNFIDADTGEEIAPTETVIFHLPKGMTYEEYTADYIRDIHFDGYEFVELEYGGMNGKTGLIWRVKYQKPSEPTPEAPQEDEPLIETGTTPPAPQEEVIENDPVPEAVSLVQTGDTTPLALLAGLSAVSAAALIACAIRRKRGE